MGFLRHMLVILIALLVPIVCAWAEANEVPPDSPFVSVDEDSISPSLPRRGSDREDTGSDSDPDTVFKKPRTPPSLARSPAKSAVPLPPLVWMSHVGAGYTAVAEGEGTLYVAAGRFLELFDRLSLAEGSQIDLGLSIQSLFVKRVAEREFVIAIGEETGQIIILEHRAESGPLVIVDQQEKKGKITVSPEGVFVHEAGKLVQYGLSGDGHLEEKGTAELEAGGSFYVLGRYWYLYRGATGSLDLWDIGRQETLASIPSNGDYLPLAIIPDAANAGAMLYFLVRNSGAINALYRVGIDFRTGLFSGPGETLALSSAFEQARVDAMRSWLYLKFSGKEQWQVLDLRGATSIVGGWMGAAEPSPGREGLYLREPHRIRRMEIRAAAPFALVPGAEHGTVGAVKALYLAAKGDSLLFLAEPSGENQELIGFESKALASSSGKMQWSTPQVVARSVVWHALEGKSDAERDRSQAKDSAEVFDLLPLNESRDYFALAAGKEGLVILKHDRALDAFVRVHRREEPSLEFSSERLFLSPDQRTLFVLFRKLGASETEKAFMNIYDVTDPRFPLFLSQVSELPLLVAEDGREMPRLTFALGGAAVFVTGGDKGVALYDLSIPSQPKLQSRELPSYSILDLDVAKEGRLVCAAAHADGIFCGEFRE